MREDGTREGIFQARLEGELLARHAALHRLRGPSGVARTRWRRRMLFAAAAILLATAAMAAAPARLTLGLGHVVTIELPAGVHAPHQHDLLVHLLDARSGVGEASASIDSSPTRGDRVLLLLFGRHIAPDRVRADLERAFPGLSSGRWTIHALEAELRTSLARALGHRVFAIEPDAAALESRRRIVLDRLGSGGWEGEATFEARDGIRLIEVRAAER
jgi:hypothetical protein